ncbi:NAD(P)/FAD-dependent oxidoreductase [Bifidobacterium miconisargentati]|uniref:NAD(P)/FAD-dependent oxidoreductase n=1 Tax=Bifidobacterium miconisargentati TaxID=2834437 RepID=UPI001BDD38EA|nr:FAD-dependent oxidoreductase [Bifidobacterium miconisargentati]MBW3090337.1 FAD-dependent oxidoreductase [Bifidobacterium miconisargentati]
MFHVKHRVIIIGSGPAGYTAAIYLGRAGFNPLVITGALAPGGQLVNTTEVENFPGFPEGILGPELMDRMRKQAERFGAEFLPADVESVEALPQHDGHPQYRLTTSDDETLETSAVIVATGSNVRKLGVPGEEELSGHGVSYCATCDGFFFKDKPIVVVGGGDSAFEEALFLTRFGSSVTLIHRRDSFRASQIMVERAKADPKLTLVTNTVVTAITSDAPSTAAADETSTANSSARSGDQAPSAPSIKTAGVSLNIGAGIGLTKPGTATDDKPAITLPGLGGNALGGGLLSGLAKQPQKHVTGVTLRSTVTGEESTLDCNAVFVAIGHTPATDFVADVVKRDADGYIAVDGGSTVTSAPGIFAAGDCVDRTYRQAISAAGMGCRAALDAQAYLE